jgi:hypothetical protein
MSDELSDIRKKAMKIIDDAGIPPLGQQINSNGSTEAKFSELTGGAPVVLQGKSYPSRHALLWANWEQGGMMTACNEFVGWYGRKLGITDNVGRFDIETHLKAMGKAHAWVKSAADVQPPKPGDILRHTAFHMDVALHLRDGVLYRVAAGQGGPIRKDGKLVGGCDILKRVKGNGPYDYTKLQGWIDIDLFFGPPPPPTPQQQPADGTTGSLWLNSDGDLVHPNAPGGGGGPGDFRVAGPLSADPFNDDPPHPWSPAARTLDPLALLGLDRGGGEG